MFDPQLVPTGESLWVFVTRTSARRDQQQRADDNKNEGATVRTKAPASGYGHRLFIRDFGRGAP